MYLCVFSSINLKLILKFKFKKSPVIVKYVFVRRWNLISIHVILYKYIKVGIGQSLSNKLHIIGYIMIYSIDIDVVLPELLSR